MSLMRHDHVHYIPSRITICVCQSCLPRLCYTPHSAVERLVISMDRIADELSEYLLTRLQQ